MFSLSNSSSAVDMQLDQRYKNNTIHILNTVKSYIKEELKYIKYLLRTGKAHDIFLASVLKNNEI